MGIWAKSLRIVNLEILSVLGIVSCGDKVLRDSWNGNGERQSIGGVRP